jgi:hypothetical protein
MGFWPFVRDWRWSRLIRSRPTSLILTLNKQFACEAKTDGSPPTKVWMVTAENTRESDALKCQIRLFYKSGRMKEAAEIFISPPFDLRPSEKRLGWICRG